MMKKRALLLALVLLTVLILFPVIALADGWEGDFIYADLQDGTVSVMGYTGVDTNITIPDTLGGKTVSAIDSYAFFNRNWITRVSIPGSVTFIWDYAFASCTSLQGVTVLSERVSFGSEVFQGDMNLTIYGFEGSGAEDYASAYGISCLSWQELPGGTVFVTGYIGSDTNVTIPDTLGGKTVTAIADNAFNGNSSINSISIPDGVTSIGDNTFFGCNSLSSVTLPSGLISIGDAAFSNTAITLIGIPDSVTSIGNGAFYGCTSLTSIDIPDGVTSIGIEAFYGCTSLTSIDIPDSVTSIGDYAFYYCYSLSSIDLSSGLISIGDYAFYCSSLSSITLPSGLISIGDGAFTFTALTSISIPDGVTSIGIEAFYGCTSLTSIDIPDSVTSIGDYAFYHCYSISSIDLPSGLISIGDYAFSNCSSLEEVTVLSMTASFGSNVFQGDTNLTLIYGLQGSTAEAYAGGNGIAFRAIGHTEAGVWWMELADGTVTVTGYTGGDTSITIPGTLGGKTVTAIADNAFNGNTSITGVSIPDSVVSIGDYAFCQCNSLSSLTLPPNLTSMGEGAFFRTAITSIDIPDGVTSIGYDVFSNCYSLSSVTLPSNLTSIGTFAFCLTSITSIDIPESVTSIGDGAFDGCSSLSTVILHNGLTSIGYGAFRGTAIVSIDIPDSVTSVVDYAFEDCASLEEVYVLSKTVLFGSGVFDNDTNLTIYGFAVSSAHSYAIDSGIPFQAIARLKFDSQGGSGIDDIIGLPGQSVRDPLSPFKSGFVFDGWYPTSACDTAQVTFPYTLTDDNTVYAKWAALALTPSVAGGSIFTGGRITITPNIAGGTWSFDATMLSRSGNEFTGLREGTARVTYTVGAQSVWFDITITASGLPSTGQDATLMVILGGAGLLVLAAATLLFKKLRHER